MTDEDETPLDTLLGRLNNEESQEELEAERAERARKDAARAFVRALFADHPADAKSRAFARALATLNRPATPTTSGDPE